MTPSPDTSRPVAGLGNRVAPWRFLMFGMTFAAGLIAGACFLKSWSTIIMVAFDGAALMFLLSLIPLLRPWSPAQMRAHAVANDANRSLLLTLGIGVSAIIFIAMAFELTIKSKPAFAQVIFTLAMAWLFSNVLYALHYAHLYYMDEDTKDLGFGGDHEPDYSDFFYFSFVIGMTSQTSDVVIKTRRMRRLVLAHGLAAFVFNLGAISFTVNTFGGQ